MKRRTFLQLSSTTAVSLVLGSFDAIASPGNNLLSLSDVEELKYHKIDQVRIKQVKMNWPRLVGKNAIKDVHGWGPTLTVYEILTDKGATGWGAGKNINIEETINFVKGKPISDLFSISTGVIDKVIPFDIALHDLAGKVLNKPVYELIGGKESITTKCYSGQLCFDDLEPADKPTGIDAILKDCEWDYNYGYRQFKLKIGRGWKWMPVNEGIKRDIEVTRTIAKAFPDCEILVDGNDGFTAETFIRYLDGISDVKLFWIEEPFRETVKDYSETKKWLDANYKFKVLLADGEANPDFQLAMELAQAKLLDVYIEDLIGLGFTKWRKLNPDLKKKGILSSPHCFGDLLKSYYTSHLIAAQGNAPTIEGVTCTSNEVDFGDYKISRGKIVPSPAPGFGMKLLI